MKTMLYLATIVAMIMCGCTTQDDGGSITGNEPALLSASSQCGPITADPVQCVIPAGSAASSTTISWSAPGYGNAFVTVSWNGGDEQLFASGTQGSQVADWIQAGHTYLFRLRAETSTGTELGAVMVTGTVGDAPTGADHLRFFGYYYNSFPGSDGATETHDHINLNHIVVEGDRYQVIENVLALLSTTRSLGLKAMVSVHPLLFKPPFNDVEPDASANWSVFVNQLVAQGYLIPNDPDGSTVASFYVIDEPDRNSLGDVVDEDGNRRANPALVHAVEIVKSNPYTAWVPTVTTVGSPDPRTVLEGIKLFDWVGFDYYGGDDLAGYEGFKGYLDLPRQRIVLVPQAGVGPELDDSPHDPYVYFRKAKEDPDVIMIMPFVWWSDHGHDWKGTRDVCGLKLAYNDIGKQIKSGRYH